MHRHALEKRLRHHLDLFDILALPLQGGRLRLRLHGVLRPLPRRVCLLEAFDILLVLAHIQHVLRHLLSLVPWRWVPLGVQRGRHLLT